jgi:phosphoesterase family protein/Big-like domain-containing protein/ASPM-SPD-2-Hydin domain-containing protein/centrosomal CEP192-like protein
VASGDLYLTGTTKSGFPTAAPYQSSYQGGDSDAVVVRIHGLSPVSLSPGSLAFSSQQVGTSSAAKTVTLTNSGSTALTVSSVAITGLNSADFQTSTCPSTVAANGGTCAINVTFTPTATGTRSATLTVTDSAVDSPQTASLAGTGISGTAPAVSLSPTSLTFASQTVGTTSAPQTVTLTNTGNAPLTITNIGVAGTNSGDFTQTNTCPSTLAASGTCTFSVTFKPTATGARSALVTITDNAAGSPHSFSLAGTGVGVLPQFGHVVIVVEGHWGYSSVVGSSSLPYFNSLIPKYGLATNFVGDTIPSLDNYFMLTVGSFEAGNDDSWNCSTTTGVVSADNIVRELVNAGKTWKAYLEGLPSAGYTGCDVSPYIKHHNPFAYLNDVANVPAQAAHMVNFTSNFASDLAGGTLPQYSFIVPNTNDNGDAGTLTQADTWLQTNIDPLIQSALFKKDGLLIVLFPYDQNAPSGCTMAQIQSGTWCGGKVAALIVSPFLVSAGYQSSIHYSSENVLRLMAQGIGLTTFPGISSTAANMSDFFAIPTSKPPTVTFTGAPASAPYQSNFTVTATTNASTLPTITGTSGVCSVGSVSGTPASASATVTMSSGTGTCSLTANWAADSNYAAATASQSTTATKIGPTVTFTGAPASAANNSTFTVAATTNASPLPTITGTSGICSVGSVSGTPASASATVTVSGTSGTCNVTANWAADSNYLAASATQSTAVGKAVSTTTITSNAPNPSAVSQAVTVSFNVTGSGTPTGTVSVSASTGETCSGTLSAGSGSCAVTFATSGSRTLTASYGGDSNFAGSTSAAVTQSVSGGVTTLAVVQVQNNVDTSGSAFTSFSVPITTNRGDLLVAFVRESSNGTDNFTVTDSAGQTWALTASGYKNESDGGPRVGMLYVANSAAVTSVTVHYTTAGGAIKPGIMVMEISGAVSSAVLDSSGNNASLAAVTTSTSSGLSTTNANDILIFATDTSGDQTGWTSGPGYAIPNNHLAIGASGSNVRMAMQYAVVSSVQANATASMTYLNSNWNGNIFAAFK